MSNRCDGRTALGKYAHNRLAQTASGENRAGKAGPAAVIAATVALRFDGKKGFACLNRLQSLQPAGLGKRFYP